MNRPLSLFVFLLFASPASLKAQEPVFHFRHMPEVSGAVYSVRQDSEGFLWIATEEGLYRYDGRIFKNYDRSSESSNGLRSNSVSVVYEDRSGTLWAGTGYFGDGTGLYRYERAMDAFTRFAHDPNDPASLSHNSILSLFEDSAGRFWIGTNGGGLCRMERESGRFTCYRADPDDPSSIDDDYVRAISEDSVGHLWLGLGDWGSGRFGLDRFDPGAGRFEHPVREAPAGAGEVMAVLHDDLGQLWFGARGIGLCRMYPPEEPYLCYRHDPNDRETLSNDYVLSIIRDNAGMLWVGTYGGGLNWVDPKTGRSLRFQNEPRNLGSLRGNYTRSIYQDRSGVLWIGDQFGGLHRLSESNPPFKAYVPPGDDRAVFGIYEDARSRLYLATGSGLFRYDRHRRSWKGFVHDPNDRTTIGHSAARTIYEDRSGTMWIGTQRGLDVFDPRTDTFTRFRINATDTLGLQGSWIRTIVEDDEGILWIADWGKGLRRVDRIAGTITTYAHDPDDSESLSHNQVLRMSLDSRGRLWLATLGGGLNLMDRHSGRFTRFTSRPGDPTSLPSDLVGTVMEGATGALWVGMYDSGLAKLDTTGNVLAVFDTDNSCLPSNVVQEILEDEAKALWLSTQRGIVRFDPAEQTCVVYSLYDGLVSEQGAPGPNSSYVTSRGELIFGMMGGAHVFSPSQMRRRDAPPQTVLSGIRLFNEPLQPSTNGTLMERATTAPEVVLTHDQNHLTFETAVLDFVRPEENRFSHFLEGFDRHWSTPGRSHTATYTNVPPGTYTFRVRGANADGLWSTEAASLRLVILPPLWRTVPAFVFYGLLLAAGVLSLAKAQQRRLIRKEREKAHRELETAHSELESAHDELRRAHEQAKVEAALERVRARAISMQESGELAEAASVVFNELVGLGITPSSCGFLIIDEATMTCEMWFTTAVEGHLLSHRGVRLLDGHPVMRGLYAAWKENRPYWTSDLSGDEMQELTDYILTQTTMPIPEWRDRPEAELPTRIVFHGFVFSHGMLALNCQLPLNDVQLEISLRFARVFDLTYRRYLELKQAEDRSREARRQASLDRIRAEIASMRTSADLERVTPLVWKELTELGVPFFRCGVFIVDERRRLVAIYLTNPQGKSLAVLHLPFDAHPIVRDSVAGWRRGEVVLATWNQDDFRSWLDFLQDRGLVTEPVRYQDAEAPPQALGLQFIPFAQGMLYVGSTVPLEADHIDLVQSLAEAFSVAYARYEDFQRLDEKNRELETAKRQVEQALDELKAAQQQLIHSEKMASLGALTAGIAHEIKNPLNFVNNFAGLSKNLVDDLHEAMLTGDTDDVEDILSDLRMNAQKIEEHGRRADAIVRSMMAHARQDRSSREEVDLNALVEESIHLAFHGMRAMRPGINVDIERDLETSTGRVVVAPQDIRRVLINLLSNAIYAVSERHASEDGKYVPKVIVTSCRANGEVRIAVRDNGPGIPEEKRAKIFEPFYTTKPAGEGTGLGLSLSYDIITQGHGGSLSLSTESGEGATFIVTLPTNPSKGP